MSLVARRTFVLDEKKHSLSYNSGTRAYIDLVVNGFLVKGYTVRQSKFNDGVYVQPPQKVTETKESKANKDPKAKKVYDYEDIACWENPDIEAKFREDIIAIYNKAKKGEKQASPAVEAAW